MRFTSLRHVGVQAGLGAAIMAVGVWLHLTERHEHEHSHGDLVHTHPHYPDAGHRREH